MNIQAEKIFLIEQITRVQDADVLAKIKKILGYQKKEVVGYSNGKAITEQQLIERIEAAETRIANGDYLSQTEVEKEAENW